MQASAIFQRTDSGRTEIKTKMHGLTQSERLALIVVDGVTPYIGIRQKLKGLTDERFNRALNNLLQKNLIFEVLLDGEVTDDDEFDAAIIERFLHQDPLDPVTIISFDVEDEFGIDMQVEGAALPVPHVANASKPTATRALSPPSASLYKDAGPTVVFPHRITTVDIYLPLEKVTVQTPGNRHDDIRQSAQSADYPGGFRAPARKIQWGQLVIAAGIVVIVISIVLKLAH